MKIETLLIEGKLNEGQLQRLFNLRRMTIFRENRKLGIGQTTGR